MKTTEALSRHRLADVALWRGVQEELHLSNREVQVAILVVLGHSVREIAVRLGIAPWTVATYLRRIRGKAGVQHRSELPAKLLLASGILLGE